MSIFTRWVNLFKGWLGMKTTEVEKENMMAGFEHLLKQKRKKITSFAEAIRQVKIQEKGLIEKRDLKVERLTEYQNYLQTALKNGDQENGIRILQEVKQLEVEIQTLEKSIAHLSGKIQQLDGKLDDMKVKYEDLKSKRDEAETNIKIKDATAGADDLLTPFSDDADKELETNLMDEFNDLRHGIEVDTEIAAKSPEAQFKELQEMSKKQQLEDEFKRMMGKQTQEQQVEQSKSGKNL